MSRREATKHPAVAFSGPLWARWPPKQCNAAMQCDVPSPESMLADHAQRNRTGRSAEVVDLLKTVNRRGNAFHSRLQLEGQKLRVVARLVQVAAMEPKGLLLCRLPHVSLLAF